MTLPVWILIGVFAVVIVISLVLDIFGIIVMQKEKKKQQEQEKLRKAAHKTMAQWYIINLKEQISDDNNKTKE